MTLTEEQKARMDRMRAAALAKKKFREAHQVSASSSGSAGHNLAQKFGHKTTDAALGPPGLGTSSFYKSSRATAPSPAPRSSPWKQAAPQAKAAAFGSKVVTATCSLTSATRFEVVASYHAPLIDLFKQLASAQYRASDRTWTFALAEHDLLLQKARGLAPGVLVTPLPANILATFLRPSTADPSTIDLNQVEAHLLDQLMPFQREGVQYGVSRKGRVLIADDMGLGKTVQALALASYYRAAWPVLVVAPSSMRFAWQAAVLRWLPTVGPQDISVITSGKDFIGDSQVVVISYDLLKKKGDELARKDYQFVILDESHMVKDAKSGRYKAVEPLARGAAYLVLLSGTPALSRPIELYTQVTLLHPKLFKGVWDYGNRYCDGKVKQIGRIEVPDYTGSSNMAELALLLRERCMVRRLKQDVLSQLPSKQRCMVVLDPGGVQSNSKEMKEKKKEAEKEGQQAVEKRASLLQWFAATATAKLKAVQEYLKDLLAADKKFLVFCHHQAMVAGVADMLDQQGVGFIRIDGRVGSEERKELVDRFQTVDKVKVAVLSITAANAGITLTAAHMVVFAELFWNPGILCQAEDRAHRIGQTDSVICQYLVAKGTADDSLWPMIQKKLVVLNKAGLSKDNFEEAGERNMEMEKQKTIDDFYKAKEEECGVEELWEVCGEEWGDMSDADLDQLCQEPPSKKSRL